MTMQSSLGILVMQHIAGGLVQDNKVVASPAVYPDKPDAPDPLQSMPGDHIALAIREQIEKLAKGQVLQAIGIGFPGIIRDGIVAESPNLQQMKGFNLQGELSAAIRGEAAGVPIRVFNDAAVTAAGIAATQGKLNKLIRVWTLGNGIGFGRYPAIDGVWEGGHTVVTLDKNGKPSSKTEKLIKKLELAAGDVPLVRAAGHGAQETAAVEAPAEPVEAEEG